MNLFSSLFWTHCLLIHYFASVFTHEFIQIFFNVANESKIKLIKCDLGYYLTKSGDGVPKKQILSYSKNYTSKFMQANYDII